MRAGTPHRCVGCRTHLARLSAETRRPVRRVIEGEDLPTLNAARSAPPRGEDSASDVARRSYKREVVDEDWTRSVCVWHASTP